MPANDVQMIAAFRAKLANILFFAAPALESGVQISTVGIRAKRAIS
jgi:hypothetical protein